MSHNCRVKSKTRARIDTTKTPTRNGGALAERVNRHTHTNTQARIGGVKAKCKPKCTHHKPQPGLAWRSPNPYQNTHSLDPRQAWWGYRETKTQTQAPHNSRKPSVHSPGNQPARAMQVTRPNEIRSPGVRLHPTAGAALKPEAGRATPKYLGTQLPDHAAGMPWERDPPGSAVNPYGAAQRRGQAEARGHTLPA